MTTTIDYKAIRRAYSEIKNSDDIYKSKQYYTSVDTSTGGYKDTSLLAGKIINDLQRLDMDNQLCGSFEVKLKHNNHDFGSYYSVEIYSVELEVDDDSDLYNIVQDYQDAGFEQIENIIRKYGV